MDTASQSHQPYVNVGNTERLLSLTGGALALAATMRTDGVSRLLLGALAAGLMYRGTTGHCPINARIGRDSAHGDRSRPLSLSSRVTVKQAPHVVYAYWRNLRNLPDFMRHVHDIRIHTDTRSHWLVKGPAGRLIEWEAEVTEDVPDERIAWRTVESEEVDHRGEVSFREVPEGTEVEVKLHYRPHGGAVGNMVGQMFEGRAQDEIRHDLQQFKRRLEAGEVPAAALTSI